MALDHLAGETLFPEQKREAWQFRVLENGNHVGECPICGEHLIIHSIKRGKYLSLPRLDGLKGCSSAEVNAHFLAGREAAVEQPDGNPSQSDSASPPAGPQGGLFRG